MPLRYRNFGNVGTHFAHLLGSAMRADEGFQKRIARQTVCPMQTRARHFPDRQQARQTGLTVEIRHYSATLVMGRGYDRNWLLGHVDPELKACIIDVREPLDQESRRLVRDVQPYMLRA